MFQNNPLLIQLKNKFNKKKSTIEGTIKKTIKGFGFLEIDSKKKYFIPKQYMKNVMHGDKIVGEIIIERDRKIINPKQLIEPFLNRFIGYIEKKKEIFFVKSFYPFLKESIRCYKNNFKNSCYKEGDWVFAELKEHKLKGDNCFSAVIIKFIINSINPLTPWYVILSKYSLEKKSPKINDNFLNENFFSKTIRKDLTKLSFITIDNNHTKDIDDALFVEKSDSGQFVLTVAIADPTEYVLVDTELDNIAKSRGYTNYLPGFNIPMLPRKISEDICSLKPFERRPVVVCRLVVNTDGSILYSSINFFLAWIISKGKLSYENVSNWLENSGTWKPDNLNILNQLSLLKNIYYIRRKWRKNNAVIFQDRPEYRFHFSNNWEIINISLESRRIAHKIIEESMIAANICAAIFLNKHLGFGLYNTHLGFDSINSIHVCNFLKTYNIIFCPKEIMTLDGFCKLRRFLDNLSNSYINYRIQKFQAFGEISSTPKPHFALGLEYYATWTSPIRKYSDMINHRLIKSIIKKELNISKPNNLVISQISERRRKTRLASRDLEDWLYADFFQKNYHKNKLFKADIIDIFKTGIKARLLNIGAFIFIPSLYIHKIKDEILFFPDLGTICIQNKIFYRVSDVITVQILNVRIETRTIVACIV